MHFHELFNSSKCSSAFESPPLSQMQMRDLRIHITPNTHPLYTTPSPVSLSYTHIPICLKLQNGVNMFGKTLLQQYI